MRLAIFLIFSAAAVQGAMAQTTFSFAGLAWGDSIDMVDSKLKSAGFSGCEALEKIKCKTFAVCSCNFSGSPVKHGMASFDDKKLESVSVYVVDSVATTAVLKQKYGQPLPHKDISQLSPMQRADEILTSRWSATTGETLVINRFSVDYVSGTRNKGAADRKRSDASNF